jgi:hypothetical protein
VDDFGIDDELPSNPLLFVLEAGTHHKYPGPLLVYSESGSPTPGNRQPIHNQRGIFHEVKVSNKTGLLKLGRRRQDVEAHNITPLIVGSNRQLLPHPCPQAISGWKTEPEKLKKDEPSK